MDTFLFIAVLLLCAAASESTITLSHPVLVTDNQAVRIDIKTETLLHHARVTRVIACSAVDKPFTEYTETRSMSTGCDSPGFASAVIYSDHGQTEVNKFLVRQTAQSLYVRRRLLNRYSPVVYLQIYIRLVNNVGADETEHVFNTRFEYPERSLPLGVDPGTAEKQEDNGQHIPTLVDGVDEAEEILGDHSESYNGRGWHWAEYVAIAAGVAGLMCVLALVAYVRRDEIVRHRMRWRQAGAQSSSYGDKRSKTERDNILGWLGAAYDRGILADRRNRP